MALKLTKAVHLDARDVMSGESNTNENKLFVPVELTKRCYQSMSITEKKSKRLRKTRLSNKTEMLGECSLGALEHEDALISDNTPCLFASNDGVSVLKEVISHFDDSEDCQNPEFMFSTNTDNVPLGCLADDYNENYECYGAHLPDTFSTVNLNLSEKANLGIGLPDIACGGKDSAEEENQDGNKFNLPLYDGCPLTLEASLILQRTFALSHNLTEQAQEQLLKLVELHCQRPNSCVTSLYEMNKHFSHLNTPLVYHKYCSNCQVSVLGEETICRNTECAKDLTASGGVSFFIEIPPDRQLKDFMNRKGFYNDIQYRFTREKINQGNIEDVYDGELYQELIQQGFLMDKNNISLMWNTDGIPVFRSSKFSIWPLYFRINELSPKKRGLKDNMILAGLWFGQTKPNMNTYLQPFHSCVVKLETDGLEVCSPDVDGLFVMKACLLNAVCDKPAKCICQNFVQFNGNCGCPKCRQTGQSCSAGKGFVRAYPFNKDNPAGPKRTKEGTQERAHSAITQGEPVEGVKGPWFLYFTYFDIIRGFCIDWMHGVLLGVVRMLLNLWFCPSNHAKLWYCGNEVKLADQRLLQICPPRSVSRKPRSIEKHRSYWKASEYRSWLFYYLLPVMQDILSEEYFEHTSLLVEAIFILTQESINPASDIPKCQHLLAKFVFLFPTLYEERYMVSNVHDLLHLCDDVINNGPLFTHSCFEFEDFNGELVSLIRGTQHVELQILNAISLHQKLPKLAHEVLGTDCEALGMYEEMRSGKAIQKAKHVIDNNNFIVGCIQDHSTDRIQPSIIKEAICSTIPRNVKSVKLFQRVMHNGSIIHSHQYSRPTKQNTYTILFTEDGEEQFGQIECYFAFNAQCKDGCEHNPCICMTYAAVVSRLDKIGCLTPHIAITQRPDSSKVSVIPLTSIQDLCVYMTFSDMPDVAYCAKMPNTVEKD